MSDQAALAASVNPDKPVDLPGLENVMEIAPGVYSGGVPTGDAGFATLDAMGIRSVLAVDASTPDLERAHARGMRYAHVPIEYAGVSSDQRLHLAAALRDLPKPVYVHCHHGKHRAPTAAVVGLRAAGELDAAEGEDKLRRAGTSPNYPGLYRCVVSQGALPSAFFDDFHPELPEVNTPEGLAATMAEVDRAWYALQGVRANGWAVPPEHPDLVPAALAGQMEVHLRRLADSGDAHGLTGEDAAKYIELMRACADATERFEAALAAGDTKAAEHEYGVVKASCNACHVPYRN